jgi:hypothetical protein
MEFVEWLCKEISYQTKQQVKVTSHGLLQFFQLKQCTIRSTNGRK